MIVAPPAYTPLPTVPSRGDPDTIFVPEAAAFTGALPVFGATLNDMAASAYANALDSQGSAAGSAADRVAAQAAATAAVGATIFADTSATNIALSNGAKAVVLTRTNLGFANTERVVGIRLGDPSVRIYGAVSLANMAANPSTMTVTVDDFAGTGGPYADWLFVLGDLETLAAATVAQLLAGTSLHAAYTPGQHYASLVEIGLTDASTIAVDMATLINANVTLAGNRTLGNPTNPKVGQRGRIRVIQDGTGSRTLAFAANWKRTGGPPTLTTTAGAIDIIEYDVVSPTYIHYEISRNPA